jgi:hypothetical protein
MLDLLIFFVKVITVYCLLTYHLAQYQHTLSSCMHTVAAVEAKSFDV